MKRLPCVTCLVHVCMMCLGMGVFRHGIHEDYEVLQVTHEHSDKTVSAVMHAKRESGQEVCVHIGSPRDDTQRDPKQRKRKGKQYRATRKEAPQEMSACMKPIADSLSVT